MPPILLALKFKALEGAAVVTMVGISKFYQKIMTTFFILDTVKLHVLTCLVYKHIQAFSDCL